jgi:peroxiredoxin
LLVFWATWCSHTSTGLTTIQDDYLIDWIDDYNLKIVAVSVDDSKTSNRAVTIANTNAWEFDVFIDENGDFKRAMGVNSAPYIFLIDSSGKIIWQQNAYLDGEEDRIEEKLSKL